MVSYQINKDVLQPDPNRVEPVMQLPLPNDLKALRKAWDMFVIMLNESQNILISYPNDYVIQVYVINPPLLFATGTIIRLTVSFTMGGFMIFIYMRFLCATVPPRRDVEHADQVFYM
ncbi:unnamed protein product [Clavelina lepadiformis]|uniref:Uncharacterized protein n=1 Tax=Clavelina lepadiformis TaxID=159417 RepID=A0ABP0FEL8_CLALP